MAVKPTHYTFMKYKIASALLLIIGIVSSSHETKASYTYYPYEIASTTSGIQIYPNANGDYTFPSGTYNLGYAYSLQNTYGALSTGGTMTYTGNVTTLLRTLSGSTTANSGNLILHKDIENGAPYCSQSLPLAPYIKFDDQCEYYMVVNISNGFIVSPVNDTSTHFISVTPAEATNQSSTTQFTIGFTAYINETDTDKQIRYTIFDLNARGLFGSGLFTGNEDQWIITPTTTGLYNFSTTTTHLYEYGAYKSNIRFEDTFLGLPFSLNGEFMATTTNWIVEKETAFSSSTKKIIQNLDDLTFNNETWDASACWVGTFDWYGCLYFLIIPTAENLQSTGDTLYQQVLVKFPLGYITSIIGAMYTEQTQAIPRITTTIPDGIAGTGATLDIGIDQQSLGWIFNATSTYGTPEQKGKTLWTIVDPYWQIVVYLALGTYILSRILGAFVIEQEVMERSEMRKNRKFFNDLHDKKFH